VSDWRIRSAAGDEIAAVLELWRAAEAHAATGSHPAGLAQLLASDGEALIVAELGGRIVGSLIAAWDGWRGNFYRLAVHPDHRREGLATALVREGECRLRECGAERLTAIVAEEDCGAREFWTAAGYECQAGRERFVLELSPRRGSA